MEFWLRALKLGTRVTAVDLKQTVQVDKDLQIRAYYAGHVLGAAMFYARVGDAAIVYTGDYNMTPDRHLGAAQIDRLQLDLVITESTYATTYRDSKYAREREFLKTVHECVAGGGKVLIPTFALGRAQELCMLLDDYWEQMNLKVPIYFSAGLTLQANMYYKMLINWTSQKVKDSYATRNAFDFKHVCSFDRSLINAPGPCVLFATPGMISGGFSLEVFKQWAPYERNLVTLPGYCVAGTIGHKLMSGKTPAQINIDKDTQIDVQCQIHQLSFSPHTDAKGILDLVKFLSPKNVILVHGEKLKIAKLKEKIQSEMGIQCFDPANNETVSIPFTTHYVKVGTSDALLRSTLSPNLKFLRKCSEKGSHFSDARTKPGLQVFDDRMAEGILMVQRNQNTKALHQHELMAMLGVESHEIKFANCCPVYIANSDMRNAFLSQSTVDKSFWLHLLFEKLSSKFPETSIQDCGEHLQIESFYVSVCSKEICPHRTTASLQCMPETLYFCCTWSTADEKLAWEIISVIKNLLLKD